MSAHILDLMFMAGLTARAEGDRLLVSPAAKVTPVMRGLILANKAAILAQLNAAEAPESGPDGFPLRNANPDAPTTTAPGRRPATLHDPLAGWPAESFT